VLVAPPGHGRLVGVDMSDATKVCTHCKQARPLEEFVRSSRTSSGRRSYCAPCAAEWARQRFTPAEPRVIACAHCGGRYETFRPAARYCSDLCRMQAKDKRTAAVVARRRAEGRPCYKCGATVTTIVGRPVCDGCKLDYRRDSPERERRRTLRKYGLTEADWDRMVAEQGNRCAICRTDQPGGKGERWHIDHCHTSDGSAAFSATTATWGSATSRTPPTFSDPPPPISRRLRNRHPNP
jgi:hypothetical protein